MRTISSLPDSRTAIADALNALWDIVGDHYPSCGEAQGLQGLIDRFLDLRPARTVIELEHRLLVLAAALDELGPWAAETDVLARAEVLSRQLN